MIIWLTGLSGSGKTTIGRQVLRQWKDKNTNVVFVDGDEVRALLDLHQGDDRYTLAGRRVVADKIHNLCAWLDQQDVNVVCCTISLFEDLHLKNRQIFSDYFEVFLSVPMDELYRRDNKNLYAPALRGELKNVIGVDIPYNPPTDPHMTIDNSTHKKGFAKIAAEILSKALPL